MQVYTPHMQALSEALPKLRPGEFFAMDADKITAEQARLVALNTQWRMIGWGFNTMTDEGKRIILRIK